MFLSLLDSNLLIVKDDIVFLETVSLCCYLSQNCTHIRYTREHRAYVPVNDELSL